MMQLYRALQVLAALLGPQYIIHVDQLSSAVSRGSSMYYYNVLKCLCAAQTQSLV